MSRILNGEALALGLDLAIGATLTPFEDTFHGNPLYGYYDEVKEKKRQAVNEWIRKSGALMASYPAASADRQSRLDLQSP